MNASHPDDPFPGSTELAALMREKDWSQTSLGVPAAWPQSLKTVASVLLTSRFAMWMGWGPDLTFLYNDAYAAMTLGAKHPWALGRPSREVWAEIWSDIGPRIERVLDGGEATWDEKLLLFLERSGYTEESYHTFSYSPVTDDDGAIRGLLCVVTEETERVIGERRMALLRDAATSIAGSSTEAELCEALARVLTTDLQDLPFTLTYLFDSGDAARLVCRSGIPADHPAAAQTIPAASHPMWPFETASNEPAGIIVPLGDRIADIPATGWSVPPTHALVVPIPRQGQKKPAGIFVAALNPFRPVDATYRSFVELLVGQIAAGVANARAYDEERRRVEAFAEIDRAKTAFFSNVSHEFRTPLTLMLGPLEELLNNHRDELHDENRDAVAMVHRNGVRLLKLVNTLLDFSRIEAGRVRAHFEEVDLCGLTTDLASTFRSAMERAELEFRVECAPVSGSVFVDRDMWEKIVLNLISNAFKFTLQGSITVRVASQDGRAVMSVEDTGVGIAERELPRVFERFHRVEGVPGRSHEGSGIGLSLVHELVRLHGGELTAASELGRGSRFTVSIPTGSAHLPPGQMATSVPHAPARSAQAYADEAMRWLPQATQTPDVETQATGVARTESHPEADAGYILLADDNADMRDYARRLLAQRWSVTAVTNGMEALDAARQRPPDVIVTDIMMPELDGFGLLKALRADPALQHIPVLMVSARAGEEARLEGLAASADDYLVKPFSARDLLARVDAQLLKSRTRAIERRHAERMTAIFSDAPVVIAVLRGPEHVYELANDAYKAVIGGRDIGGLPIRKALPELEGQGIYELLDTVRSTGEPFIGKSWRVMLNRGPNAAPEETYFDFVYQPMFDDAGRVESIVVIAHDVTALTRAKQEAEVANRLKDEFLATLSHELRTPLNAVLGYTQMLRGGVIGPDRVPTVLETIERNAKLQDHLVSDVLDVSRIITGKLHLDVQPVDLADVIHDALETVAPAASAKGVTIRPPADHPDVPIAGDAQRLQQVVWNLLSNAVKFTPRGGRVDVRVRRVDSQVELVVSDTGEGIAPEFLPHLFQRFTQADATFTRAHGGLGLGLAISRHLVEAHGGHIEATSPGKSLGTTVRIELPLTALESADVERDGTLAFAHAPAGDLLRLPDLTGIRVLVVDDDLDAAEMAKEALTVAKASVVCASSAVQALQTLDSQEFDVAILDIGMPEVDGYSLVRQIRQRPAKLQGNIPAAALTAYARPTDRAQALDAGFQMHLAKPIQPSDLAAAVRALADAHLSTKA